MTREKNRIQKPMFRAPVDARNDDKRIKAVPGGTGQQLFDLADQRFNSDLV